MALLGCAVLLSATGQASAQLFHAGPTTNVLPGTVRGTDSAFDPGNNVYLVVGAHGIVNGVFVNSSGVAVTAPFPISNGAGHAHFPRVAYGAGGFLVTWHQNIGAQNYVHARRVTYPGVLGGESIVSTLDPPAIAGSWWEAGAALAYSSASQLFLVAWQTCCGGTSVVQARPVNIHGTPVAPVQQISGGYARDPGVAWNPGLNEFGISYSGADPSSAIAAFARTNVYGGVVRRNVVGRSSGTYISDIAFNSGTGRYVMVWFQGATFGAEIDGSGDAIAAGLISPTVGAYDGLGLAFQPVSRTFLLVGHHFTGEIGALELNRHGAQNSGEIAATMTGGRGMFYPRASASVHETKWNTAASGVFTAILNGAVGTTTSNGGSSASLGAPPNSPSPTPAPAPTPGACPGTDPFVAIGGGTCVNGGWLPPGAVPAPAPAPAPPPSGGCTTVQPMAGWICVNGGWVPPTSAPAPAPAPPPPSSCGTPQPVAGWVCVNGGWVPPNSPLAPPPATSCTTPSPGSGWVCVNGGWVPSNSPLAPAQAPSTSSCTTAAPGAGWICVNGGWVPPNSPLAPTAACTTVRPGPDWTCSPNGSWLPPGM